ncbi:MAG: hypothetical protein AVDCRST_MAG59-362, partial [uncultured Thermomicrobiales bacterium]
ELVRCAPPSRVRRHRSPWSPRAACLGRARSRRLGGHASPSSLASRGSWARTWRTFARAVSSVAGSWSKGHLLRPLGRWAGADETSRHTERRCRNDADTAARGTPVTLGQTL